MTTGELFLPPQTNDFLADCKSWQRIITDIDHPVLKDEVGRQACLALFGRTIYQENRRVITKSDIAIVLPHVRENVEDPTSVLQFGAITAAGYQGSVNYFRLHAEGLIAVPLYDAKVMEQETIDTEALDTEALENGQYIPTNRPARLPIQLPVEFIDYALPAAL